jgi:anaerobic selenocysteine-containing dehydrogenase
VSGAEANGQKLNVENGETIDVSALRGDVKVRAAVEKR